MPGIFGFIRKKEADQAANELMLREMLKRLSHNEHYIYDLTCDTWYGLGNIGLPVAGEERLAVHQETGFAAAFSGYIYGWKVSGEAADRGPGKKASYLIELYRKHQSDLPEKIDGSFNLAVFDSNHKKALIGNDRFGHRQLYYYEDPDLFMFSTEIKAFPAYPKFRREINLRAVYDYFNYGYPLGEKTFFRDVRILRGGHTIEYTNGQVSRKKYWDYKYGEESSRPMSEMIDEIDALYRDIIRTRINNSKEQVIPLSGGLDSRFILSHVLQAGGHPHTFTHGRKNCHDHIIARKVAKKLNVGRFTFINIDPAWLVDYFEKYVYLTEGMVDASPAILLGISRRYGLPPESTAFINGIFGGPTNFGSSYFKPADIAENVAYSDKLKRIAFSLGGESTENIYKPFEIDLADRLKNNYMTSIEEEFSGCLDVSPLFCNQKDVFFIRNRIFRYMNLVDCNRFIWHDHFALADDRLVDFFLKLPARMKPSRAFMIEYFKAKMPDLARITYQGTGVDLYHYPSPFKKRLDGHLNRGRHYLERLSGGSLRLYNPKNYHHYNQWYRGNRSVRRFYEENLLDTRTVSRGYYKRDYLEFLLSQQRRGANNFSTLTSLLTFEIFNRLFID